MIHLFVNVLPKLIPIYISADEDNAAIFCSLENKVENSVLKDERVDVNIGFINENDRLTSV